MNSPTPLEELVRRAAEMRSITIGLPMDVEGPDGCSGHNLCACPLTPEAASMLITRGFRIKMEAGAGMAIHYDDAAYSRAGVAITDRREALACDIVLHPGAVAAPDARLLKRGCVLMTFLDIRRQSAAAIKILLERHVIAVALDLVTDTTGNRPFAEIINEVAGRAAMALASSLLANPVHGKGILLGGVAGVVPCEVAIIGSGIAARSAALSALGLGASVMMFDDDAYSLREAVRYLGEGRVVGSALHPRVFTSAIRTADVVVATDTRRPFIIGAEAVDEMKRGIVAFDLTSDAVPDAFPSLPTVDFATGFDIGSGPAAGRTCYINPAAAVPRTAAMAIGTTLLTLMDEIMVCDGMNNALKLNRGMRSAAYTFLGKVVNQHIARISGQRYIDINLILQFN